MWLVADLFERYTTNVAKTFLKIAAMEAEANRRALDTYRARRVARSGLVTADAPLETRAPLVHPHSGEALSADAPAPVLHVPERERGPVSEAPVLVERPALVAELPMGVRADVVARWCECLAGAASGEMSALLERLRKDKKVRVPELQFIAAGVLREEPQMRKKADHLAALRQHLVAGTERRGVRACENVSLHA